MRLTAISIDGVGLFSGRFTCQFPGEIALIIGDNETGKSTLVAAIGAILFGFSNESEKELFAPAPGELPRSGSLDVAFHEAAYRFTRDFNSNRVRVERLDENVKTLFDGTARPSGRSDEKERYNKLLGSVFGIEDRDLFYNSVFVEQGKLPTNMEGVLRRIVSGSVSADYALVQKELKALCEELTVAVPWGRSAARKARQIEKLDGNIRNYEIVLKENRDAAAAIQQMRERLRVLETKATAAQKSVDESIEHQKKLESFVRHAERKKQVEERLNHCRKERDETDVLQDELKKTAEEIQENFRDYLDLPQEAEKDFGDFQARERVIEELKKRRQQSGQSKPHFRLRKSASALIAFGVAVAAIGILALDGFLAVLFALAGIAAIAGPFLFAAVRLNAERSAHQGKLNELDDQLRDLARRHQEVKGHYPLLSTNNADDILKQLHSLRRLQAEKEKKEEALRQHPPLEQIEEEFNKLSNELLTVDHQLVTLKEEHPSLSDVDQEERLGRFLEEAKRGIDQMQSDLRRLVSERDDVRYQLARAEARETVSEEALDEELSEQRAQLGRLKLYREAYLQAVEVLDEAISEFRASHLSRIEEKTSHYLSAIIGKACKVHLDKNLDPLYVEQGEQKFQPKQLSRGAQDQLFFALRLSAIDEICEDVSLPLVLDDPFVNFDENRLAEAQAMLDTIAKSHQVILLTHDRRYTEWKKPAVLL